MRDQIVEDRPERRIAALATRQHGVVSHAQLGLSKARVHRWVEAGRLHRVHRGVYAVGHRRLTREGYLMAAVLAAGDGAVLSHRAAAGHWGLIRWSGTIEVSVPTPGGRRRRRAGFVVCRTELEPWEVTVHEGIPITGVARTLVDLGAVLAIDRLERAVAEAEKRGLFDLSSVKRVLERHPRLPGRVALKEVLAKWVDVKPEYRSRLERAMHALCRKHGLPHPAVNCQVEGYTVDFVWWAQRLIVETDGYDTHSSYPAFEDDRTRDARLTVAGYRVVRFTYWQVKKEQEYVAAILRPLLRTYSA